MARISSSAEQNGGSAQRKLVKNQGNGAGLSSGSGKRHRKLKIRSALKSQAKAAESGVGHESDSDSDADESNDDSDEADGEPSVNAPSETVRQKRGHQTGLSVSLSNTNLYSGGTPKKRTWGNRVREEDDMTRPVKLSKPVISESAVDSDDDYAGVDQISESDEEEYEKAEELQIVQSEEEYDHGGKRPQPLSTASLEAWPGTNNDVHSTPVDDGGFFAEHFGRTDPYGSNALFSPASFDGFSFDEEVPTPKPQPRRVRFADDVRGSSSSAVTTDAEQDLFPDLFLQQDSLDPSFRRLIEEAPYEDGGIFLFDIGLGDNNGREAERRQKDGGSSSGYETDLGETTDEEILPPKTINRPQQRLGSNTSTPRATPSKPARRAPIARMSGGHRQGPSLASWTIDPGKPYAVVDKDGIHMVFHPARRPQTNIARNLGSTASSTSTSPTRANTPSANKQTYDSENDRSDSSSQAVLLRSPANLMMSGFAGNDSSTGPLFGPATGPPEAFYPWRSVDAQGNMVGDDDDYENNDTDDEPELDIFDFIDFGDDFDNETGGEDTEEVSNSKPIVARQYEVTLGPGLRSNRSAVKHSHKPMMKPPITPLKQQKSQSPVFEHSGGAIKKRIANMSKKK